MKLKFRKPKDITEAIKWGIMILVPIIVVLIVILIVYQVVYEEKTIWDNTPKSIEDTFKFSETILYEEQVDEGTGHIYMLVKFAKPLIAENRQYFDYLVGYIAKNNGYKSFTLIDETDSNNVIQIDILCSTLSESIYSRKVNGIENYFDILDSLEKAKEYKAVESVNFSIESEQLKMIKSKGWHSEYIDFGIEDGIFQNYKIFFDRGYQYKVLGEKVFNIIYTDKYKDTVVNGIKVGASKEEVINILGEPHFKDEDTGIIGYKGTDIYVFFVANQISIYPIEETSDLTIANAVKSLEEGEGVDVVLAEIVKKWPDYTYYYWTDYDVSVQYPHKGITLYAVYEEVANIHIYNNYQGIIQDQYTFANYIEGNIQFSGRVLVNSDINSLFEYEIGRYNAYIGLFDQVSNYAKESPNGKIFISTREEGGLYFASTNDEKVNKEILTDIKIDSFDWINDDKVAYSVVDEGIYLYEIKSEKITSLIKGNDEFFIWEANENQIIYDDDKKLTLK